MAHSKKIYCLKNSGFQITHSLIGGSYLYFPTALGSERASLALLDNNDEGLLAAGLLHTRPVQGSMWFGTDQRRCSNRQCQFHKISRHVQSISMSTSHESHFMNGDRDI